MPFPVDWILRGARAATEAAIDFALPQRCPGCGAPAEPARVLCAPCRSRIPRLEDALCVRCLVDEREGWGCRRHAWFRAFVAWVYDERAAAVVHALKFSSRPGVARPLGSELAAAVGPEWRRPDLLVAVPLHRARRRERGYNPAALLAEALALELGAPHATEVVSRHRATPPQSRLGPAARRANVAGAFTVRRPSWVRGRRVLVVDDVVTTGATLVAVMAALRAAGAETAAAALAWAS